MGPNGSLCVHMKWNWVLICPYASFGVLSVLLVLMCLYGSLCVPYWSLCVLKGPFKLLCVLIGFNGS